MAAQTFIGELIVGVFFSNFRLGKMTVLKEYQTVQWSSRKNVPLQ